MLGYKFICPHCKTQARIIERAESLVRETDLVGFNEITNDPEFSIDEEYGDDESYISYLCSHCGKDLDVQYHELREFILEFGTIGESNGAS